MEEPKKLTRRDGAVAACGFNMGVDSYKKFLPDEEEIYSFIDLSILSRRDIAIAIAKRIGKENKP